LHNSKSPVTRPAAEAALFEEILFEPPELLVEEVFCQLDQSDHHIGGDQWVGVFDAFLEGFVIGVGLAIELAETFGVAMLLGPFLSAAQPQEVAVVFEQFAEAGASHAGELDFGFFGSAGRLAAFKDVLFAGACGLNHLVIGAVGFFQEALAEAHRAVIDNPGLLEGEQILVATVGWDEVFGHTVQLSEGTKGTKSTIGHLRNRGRVL
jgi:hypothetical protein